MNVFKTFVAIWSINIFEQNVEAVICLKCDYVVQPRHCKTVIPCPDDDSCFVERQTDAFGEVGYSLGCLEKQSCHNSTSGSRHCTQCCDRNLCNNGGCGVEGYPSQRGPVCYNCETPLPEGRCHIIDVCPEGKVCSLNGEDTFGTTLFTSRCMPKDHCENHQSGVLVGRRSQVISTLTKSRGLKECSGCCAADLCNTNCKTKDTAKDCSELRNIDFTLPSAVYNITTPLTNTKIQVYCDMETDGGGWTIFQRRFDGSEDFYRNFRDYENGFGSVHAEHWLGLKYIYEITSSGSYQLRVDILRYNGSTGYDVYSNFSLQPKTNNYTLNLGPRVRENGVAATFYSEVATSSAPVGHEFSTYDRGNVYCASFFKSGWWFGSCYENILLNGIFMPGQKNVNNTAMIYDGIDPLKGSKMMFKAV